MRRAKSCFDKINFHCDTYATNLQTGTKSTYYWDQYFVPDFTALFGWNNLIKEWVGYLSYDIMGYI